MLNKPTYEALPYAYILGGAVVLITQSSPLAWLSGLALYAGGALIWLMRARYRSTGIPARRTLRRLQLPGSLYEMAPFLYIAAGLLTSITYLYFDGYQSQPLTLAAAVMFFGAGMGSWLMRASARGYHRAIPVRIDNDGPINHRRQSNRHPD